MCKNWFNLRQFESAVLVQLLSHPCKLSEHVRLHKKPLEMIDVARPGNFLDLRARLALFASIAEEEQSVLKTQYVGCNHCQRCILVYIVVLYQP